jgi:hypothetical protein
VWTLLLIPTYFAPQLVASVALSAGEALAALPINAPVNPHLQAIALSHVLNHALLTLVWRVLVAAIAVAVATPLARRGHRAAALYLGVFGLLAIRSELSGPGQLLSGIVPGSEDLVDGWWVVLFTIIGLAWWARGRLTRARASRLLFVLTVGALLRQTDFLANPFSPVLGFAGIYFVAFGIAWDALTMGTWANAGSVRLPRVSRVFLYLGYVLITLAVINWTFGTHDLVAASRLTGDQAIFGFTRFGLPLIYVIYGLMLALPPEQHDTSQGERVG